MMKKAGSFLRAKMTRLTKWGILAGGILMGLAVGLLFLAVERWIGSLGVIVVHAATAAAVFFAWRILDSGEWNLDNLEKGEKAERRVGQAIEYAITARDCAVAHSVTDTEIAKLGDIDHIVATPKRIWVIETKYKAVPKKIFPKVLSGIAANTDAVRKRVPAGTPVQGCLVLAYECKGFQPTAQADSGEEIRVYTEKTLGDLRSELRKDARGTGLPDGQFATDVWNLGWVAK